MYSEKVRGCQPQVSTSLPSFLVQPLGFHLHQLYISYVVKFRHSARSLISGSQLRELTQLRRSMSFLLIRVFGWTWQVANRSNILITCTLKPLLSRLNMLKAKKNINVIFLTDIYSLTQINYHQQFRRVKTTLNIRRSNLLTDKSFQKPYNVWHIVSTFSPILANLAVPFFHLKHATPNTLDTLKDRP